MTELSVVSGSCGIAPRHSAVSQSPPPDKSGSCQDMPNRVDASRSGRDASRATNPSTKTASAPGTRVEKYRNSTSAAQRMPTPMLSQPIQTPVPAIFTNPPASSLRPSAS